MKTSDFPEFTKEVFLWLFFFQGKYLKYNVWLRKNIYNQILETKYRYEKISQLKEKIYVNYINYMILIYNILFTIVRKIISHTKFC